MKNLAQSTVTDLRINLKCPQAQAKIGNLAQHFVPFFFASQSENVEIKKCGEKQRFWKKNFFLTAAKETLQKNPTQQNSLCSTE